jgi:hypothetical protein
LIDNGGPLISKIVFFERRAGASRRQLIDLFFERHP